MSSAEAEAGEAAGLPEEFEQLEGRVRKLLEELAGYRARAEMAEERSAELEKALRDVSSGALDPMQLRERTRKLKAENEELRDRMVAARDRIRRLVSRFDFLREEL
ncbi:MAG: hypothetical protein R3314_03375 [Longimicrobiales bacterium]|nr:hypothetical protein [Longimicrobiales bacterium]